MNTADERDIDPIEEITRIAQVVLDLPSWGFRESYRSTKPGKLIHDSQWCRISLIWGGWDYGGGSSIHIRYGRLHAPDEKITMLWNGEECRCWHDFDHALHFLDGHSPAEAVKLKHSHPLLDPFYSEEISQKFDRRQPEWLAQMHVTLWQAYGNSFFELFDLRRADLWQKYRLFLKEYYDIKGRSPVIKPPLDKVC
jgi:hypothetical protein